MMSKLSSFFGRLFSNKKFLLILSLVLSFLIWYGFKQYYNPVTTRNIKNVPISFSISNTSIASNDLQIISHNIDSVEIVVAGKTADVMKLSATDLTVTPSLSGISKAGEYTVALNYTRSSILSDFEVVSISPKTVKIFVDSVSTRTFDRITPEANGVTAPVEGGLIKETPRITDSAYGTLTVSGAQTKVDKIETVVLRTTENKEIKQTTQFEASVVLLDEKGKEISHDGLDLSFDKAEITVPVSKTKEVSINAIFTNAPSKLFCDYSFNVSTVTLIGDPKTIDSMSKVDLMPINYSLVTKTNNVFDCGFNLPAGVRIHEGPETVKVTLDTASVRSKTVKVSKIQVSNVNSSLGKVVLNNPVTVVVYGNRSDISKITAANLTVNVNLGEYSKPGKYTVPATIKLDGTYDTVWATTFEKEYTAYITIN